VWQARYLVQRKCYGRLAAAAVRGVDVLAHGMRCLKLRLSGRGGQPEYAAQRQLFQMLLSRI
jgi:hypothetical protein